MGDRIGLHVPKLPRGDFEHLLSGYVEITDEVISIDRCCLEGIGKRRHRKSTRGKIVEVVVGRARFRWKNESDREAFRRDQQTPKRNKNRTRPGSRWSDVEDLVAAIHDGHCLPMPPLLHPSLHGGQALWIIDGCRRFVAHVEAEISPFNVAVVREVRDGRGNGSLG